MKSKIELTEKTIFEDTYVTLKKKKTKGRMKDKTRKDSGKLTSKNLGKAT
eukprot:m.280828 g.280828  ORF g.280828 m.280828 type:complete len:50 (-) comp149846_c0_seq1:45-194(-)